MDTSSASFSPGSPQDLRRFGCSARPSCADAALALRTAAAERRLDCHRVGSLGFDFLGNHGVFHSTPKEFNFLEGQQQPRRNRRALGQRDLLSDRGLEAR